MYEIKYALSKYNQWDDINLQTFMFLMLARKERKALSHSVSGNGRWYNLYAVFPF
jgi:uncharacterized protein YprB with RNaseH-like and TPR domain